MNFEEKTNINFTEKMLYQNNNTIPAKIFNISHQMSVLPKFLVKPSLNFEPFSFNNLLIKKAEEEKFNFLNYDFSKSLNPSLIVGNPDNNLNETDKDKKMIKLMFKIESLNIENKKRIFKVNYPDRVSLFTNTERNITSNEEKKEKDNEKVNQLLKRKKRRPRKENKDNIRRKIKRGFLNTGVIQKLNQKLVNYGSKLYFTRFPQSFVSDIFRKTNKEIVNMTLAEIFVNKEINMGKRQADLNNYYHNLKVVNSDEIKENEELQKILNMKYCDLFEDYLNSDEFKIDEINRLKRKNMSEEFINRYVNISKTFIEFFTK
jgi:hypothetical protein